MKKIIKFRIDRPNKNIKEGKMSKKFPYFPLCTKYTENDKYKCKGCGNIIVADPRELPQFCPECGTEYSYMKILPAI